MSKHLLFCAISLYLCHSNGIEVLTSFYNGFANHKKIAKNLLFGVFSKKKKEKFTGNAIFIKKEQHFVFFCILAQGY